MSNLQEMFAEQLDFTRMVMADKGYDLANLQPSDKIFWTKEYVLALVKELTEVLDNIDWKHHKKRIEMPNENNVTEELIDIQKFLWGIMSIWGIDEQLLQEMFWKKSFVVRERWRQGHNNLAAPKAVLDLDGVLCLYPESFLSWCKQKYPCMAPLSKKKNPILWEDLKDKYRASGGKQIAIEAKDASFFTEQLHNHGWSIVLFTYRPINLYNNIEYDTLIWLKEHRIIYDQIIWAGAEKSFYFSSGALDCDLFIDDDSEVCEAVASLGKNVYSPVYSSDMVRQYNNLKEILKECLK